MNNFIKDSKVFSYSHSCSYFLNYSESGFGSHSRVSNLSRDNSLTEGNQITKRTLLERRLNYLLWFRETWEWALRESQNGNPQGSIDLWTKIGRSLEWNTLLRVKVLYNISKVYMESGSMSEACSFATIASSFLMHIANNDEWKAKLWENDILKNLESIDTPSFGSDESKLRRAQQFFFRF